MKFTPWCIGLVLLLASQTLAQEPKPATTPATTKTQAVLAECVSFQDQKLTLKFRTEDPLFKSYIRAPFTYPRDLGLQKAKVGETYIITFKQGEAAHNVKKAMLVDPANLPKDFPDDSMIGKVVGIREKDAKGEMLDEKKQGVVVEFVQDEHVATFFAKNQVFPLYNSSKREYKAGQVIKVSFGPDNRHRKGSEIVDEKKPN